MIQAYYKVRLTCVYTYIGMVLNTHNILYVYRYIFPSRETSTFSSAVHEGGIRLT